MIPSFHHYDFPLDQLLRRKRESISVVLPAREVADTIGPIIEQLQSLDPLIDQILVIDAASEDGTAEVAAGFGADVRQESELLPEFGQALGKGDAMWRALAVARGEQRGLADRQIDPFRLSRSIAAAVQHFTSNDASKLQVGQAQYSGLLYDHGAFVDRRHQACDDRRCRH